MNTDEKIMAQVCAKIAGDLVPLTGADNVEDIFNTFSTLYKKIHEEMTGSVGHVASGGGREVPVLTQDQMKTKLTGYKAKSVGVTNTGDTVEIVGESHGPIPGWLIIAARNAGVTKVWDNRDTATAENRRPQFVSADKDKKAFWAPKEDQKPSKR